jgi:uncharacterized protein (TIGR03437 family)
MSKAIIGSGRTISRRELARAAFTGLAWAGGGRAQSPPTAPVAVERCRSFGREFELALARAIDGIGGIGGLVRGKTVALKLNLTGTPESQPNRPELPFRTHPDTVLAVVTMLARNGARRVRILECFQPAGQDPALWARYGLDVNAVNNAGCEVEWENTNYLGRGASYTRLRVPSGGYIYPGFDLNHSYADCDVYVSLSKLKNHWIAGITLGVKNNFGITPCSLYGGDAWPNGNEDPRKNRSDVCHLGAKPADGVPAELDPSSPREAGYRVPRITVDLLGARPIDLSIIDGVESIRGGEGPWNKGVQWVRPGLLLAGRNPVATDAVAMAVMGYDPQADRGARPFVQGDNMLKLAEAVGIGTTDLGRIEVAGLSVREALFDFGPGPVGAPVDFAGSPASAYSAAHVSGMLAPGSIVSVYGRAISSRTVAASAAGLTALGGVRVEVTDGAGVTRPAAMLFVSPGQANIVIPEASAPGAATLVLVKESGERLAAAERIYPVAPGIFTADGTGSGVAAAYVERASPGGRRETQLIFGWAVTGGKVTYQTAPVSLGGPEDTAALVLFLTGIRRLSAAAAVKAVVGGEAVPVLYAGPQPEFQGLDQVNLLLPRSLAGRGLVEVHLEAQGEPANVVRLAIA